MLHDSGRIKKTLRTSLALMTNDLHESILRTYSGSSPAESSASWLVFGHFLTYCLSIEGGLPRQERRTLQ